MPLDTKREKAYTEQSNTAQARTPSMRLQQYYKDFIRDLEEKGRSLNTIRKNELYLYGSLSHSIQAVDPEKIQYKHYLKAIEAGKVHGLYGPVETARVFKQFLHFLSSRGVKTGLHWRDLKSPRLPKKRVEYLTKEEVQKIRNHFPNTDEGLRTRAMFELALSTGMRIGEVVSLDKHDLSFKDNSVQVVNIKTGELNTLSFTKRAAEAIQAYLKTRTDQEPCLFYAKHNGRLKTVTARFTLTKYEKELKLGKPLYWHILRKTFLTQLLMGGMNVKEVQTKGRHASPQMTLRHYIGIQEEEATKKQIDIMEGI